MGHDGNAESFIEHRSVGDVTLERRAYTLRTRSSVERLTKSEFAVLDLLMKRPERVYTYDELTDAYAGGGYRVTATAVRVLIHRVRRKLGDDGWRLQALRGVGFFMSDADPEDAAGMKSAKSGDT